MTHPDGEEAAAVEPSLQQMTLGYVPAQILYTAAELGIADALAGGPRPYDALAGDTGTDPAALRRLLRALAALGLVTQLDTERFALTDLGGLLRTDAAGSARDEVRLSVTPQMWQAWGALTDVVRTGRPHRDPGSGLTAHQAIAHDPELSVKLRESMALATREFADGVAKAYDFSAFRAVAAPAGDHGTLLAAVLGAVPGLRGVLYDRPEVLESALAVLGDAGVVDRCETVAGDGTGPVPSGADAYVLNNVVRDRDDEQATALLLDHRTAMAPTARLILVETLMPPVLTPEESAAYGLTDLNNLVFTGGRERTRDEYGTLLAAAGFALTATAAVPVAPGLPDYHVLEAVPTA
ncbi:hypothetical protein ABIE67_008303 [Streptomyces sp. V4I8]|uniref:methyltransferase n=1 Tax=Streptomyces sp. V4I8 TaxID=3156469 RepID=UPI003514BDA8